MTEEFIDIELMDIEGEIAGDLVFATSPLLPVIPEDDLEKEPLIIKYGMIEYRKKRLR